MSNPVTITLTLDDKGIDALATAIAARIGGDSRPALTPQADPPASQDKPKKESKKAAEKAEKPAPKKQEVEEPAEEPADTEAQTTDLVTEAQLKLVEETAAASSRDEASAQLADFYIGQGSDKKEVQEALAGMSDEEVTAAYADYLARLLTDETGEFAADFDTPYIATRINDGAETKVWVKGGVTLNPEEVKAAKLADPNAPKEEAKKPGLPKRTLRPGAK